MTLKRAGDLAAIIGGLIAALGLGARFASTLGEFSLALIGTGLAVHATGHVLQFRAARKTLR